MTTFVLVYVVLRWPCGCYGVEARRITRDGIAPTLVHLGRHLGTAREAIPKSTKNVGRREGDPDAIVEVWL